MKSVNSAIKHDQGKVSYQNYGQNFDLFFMDPITPDTPLHYASKYISELYSKYMCKKLTYIDAMFLLRHVLSNLFNYEINIQNLTSQVFEFGAKKYHSLNYAQPGLSVERLVDAFRRHIYYYPYILGETVDQESNLPHIAHATSCVLMLAENILNGNIPLNITEENRPDRV